MPSIGKIAFGLAVIVLVLLAGVAFDKTSSHRRVYCKCNNNVTSSDLVNGWHSSAGTCDQLCVDQGGGRPWNP